MFSGIAAYYDTPNERTRVLESFFSYIFSNQLLVFIVVALLLLVFTEFGYLLGLRVHRKRDSPRKDVINGAQASVLGLLGLLLGFTFSMALIRFEARRDLVLEEAGSIRTAYMRATFLPPADEVEYKNLLEKYIEARVSFYDAGDSAELVEVVQANTAALQKQIWLVAARGVKANTTELSETVVEAVNDMIMMDRKRNYALGTKIPGALWLLVLIIAGAGCFASGNIAGANGTHSAMSNILLPLLITVVITLISDLDRERQGMIGINQQALYNLRTTGSGGMFQYK